MADLSRFHEAQDRVWPEVLAELRDGRKTNHWMWFIFPQLRGLGRSETARFYGIADLAEARAYLADPVLRTRLHDAAVALLSHPGLTAEQILGPVDAMKLRSSATLFARAAEGEMATLMHDVLARFHGGSPCPLTEAALDQG
ncbi:DUF1810 domain-containing protein [Albidovulum sediminicola]|uniref:DUF1810 domain-containing protein n=1 Tax=Albidovulum sediminicola TaxID=2984331 RepID=A0ABT2YXS4_9RHOB|nr:DUF1810 domain-containing protein [Defluviimonas sp. WL0075]MCV2863683.1 DUF1810 domain-containing protein [Defluviimonas sp. WL0075]